MATATSATPIGPHPQIKDAGVKGFLKWMQTDPVMVKVYNRIKPQLQAMIGQSQLGYFGDDNSILLNTPDLSSSGPDLSTISAPTIPDNAITANAPTDSSGSSSWLSSLTGIISAAGQAVLTATQISTASKVTGIQLTRAQQGLPPLNLNAYGVSATPGFNLGLSAQTQTLLMWGAAGLLGVWLLTSLFKHRSSAA